MYQNVIFDLDGTLLNTIDDLADAGNWVCAQRGWPEHTVEEYKRMVGNGIPKLVERFAPEQARDQATLKEALAQFSARYNAHKEDKTAAYPGMVDLIARLKAAGVNMAVLTNKADPMARPVVEAYYPGLFPTVQGALPGMPTKPDPTLLHKLMERMNATRENTLFVGDSNVDIQTAKNGGLTSCGVLWGFRSRQELEQDKGYDGVLACGPKPMLRNVAKVAEEFGIPCQVSMEERMGCGVGACLVCACDMADGSRKHVCKDGPVFDSKEVDWNA